MHSDKQGFSLLELSIVLVIIGLMAGGVIVGDSLIKAAEIRSFTTGLTQYKTAILLFNQKYNALPGDFNMASSYWTGATNGTGDGRIPWNNKEGVYMWNHLGNADLISGNYSGNYTNFAGIPGTNIPVTAIEGSGVSPVYDEVGTVLYGNVAANRLMVGTAVGNNPTHGAIFTPEDAYNLDEKIDDGNPSMGKILSANGDAKTACITGTTRPDVTYQLAIESVECKILYQY